MSRMTRTKFAPIPTVVAALVIIVVLLFFLIWASITIQTTAAMSTDDMGLTTLRFFGFFSPQIAWLMAIFACLSFVYSIKEYRKKVKQDNSQAVRFMIIGCAFIVVAIMIGIFSTGMPVTFLDW